jgi:ATP-dependent DNA helicase RecQ
MELNTCAVSQDDGERTVHAFWCTDGLLLALRQLGLRQFREGQREVVEAVLAGQDVLAIMPTGSGKSLCYQLPCTLMPGVTVVVSPLVALMQDQARRAADLGIRSTTLTSLQGREDREARLLALARGAYDLCFVAPEGLRSAVTQAALREAGVSLLAVDEAHCISAWGQDFRPDYARLGEVRQALAPRSVLALTATATPEAREDVAASLRMTGPVVVHTGMDRPNLRLAVEAVRGAAGKLEVLVAALGRALAAGGSAIVYCATRRAAESVAEDLRDRGWNALAYHAGLAASVRQHAQAMWDRGDVPVMCATAAFGMGVDKADVRLVVHHAVPRSLEAYWQEAGRAGRDGLPAEALLLHDGADVRLAWRILEASCPTPAVVRQAYGWAWARSTRGGWCPGTLESLAEEAAGEVGLAARVALGHLCAAGFLAEEPHGVVLRAGAPGQVAVDQAALARRTAAERKRLAHVVAYVGGTACRREALARYFGAGRVGSCGACDLCARGEHRTPTGTVRDDALKVLACVGHLRGRFGRGRVVEVLLGARTKPLTGAGLDQVPSWGGLRGVARQEVVAVLSALERAGLVVTRAGEYPTLHLSPAGERALRDGVLPGLWFPRGDAVVGGGLQGRLEGWRAQAARRLGIHPTTVLPDHTLRAVAALRPRTALELAQVPGMGARRVQQVGPEILGVVREG